MNLSDADDRYDSTLVAKTLEYATAQLDGQGAGHGMDHVLRVLRLARVIQAEVRGDRMVVDLAAILHDVGDAKFHDGVERSAEFSRQILGELGAATILIDHVAQIVDNISFRKREEAQPLSLEGQIVQDADRLDALGAIGIVRTIEYGAVTGQPFYSPDDATIKAGIGHFHDKLFKLRELMNTDAGRRLAVDRERFMQTFLDQFLSECSAA